MLGYVGLSIIHRTLTWTAGSLTCVCQFSAHMCIQDLGLLSFGRGLKKMDQTVLGKLRLQRRKTCCFLFFLLLLFMDAIICEEMIPKCFPSDAEEFKNLAVCGLFPVRFECGDHTRLLTCVCPSTLVSYSEQREFEFNAVNTKSQGLVTDFSSWLFPTDHRLFRTFPVDPETKNFLRQVTKAVFSIVHPTPFKSGTKLALLSSDALSEILDLSPSVAASQDFLKFVSGQLEIESAIPLSHRYGGHQFGQWAGQLGDGRAVMLGEYVNKRGVRWELQLKGSGLTPYSRRGDGRAVIRSSVREFLCSEAMYHLGIPTSRAASLVLSNDTVIRDQFYDGHPRPERTAVVLRLARSWFRIGSLEILTYSGETRLLRQLVDFIIAEYFPDIDVTDPGKLLAFFQDVVRETAGLIALWQSVGFTHGVCNTDNFSLLSVTIDYGPFGFLDAYDPKFVPNTSDDEHRYSYENQPDVGVFNLEKLRLALSPLWTKNEIALSQNILRSYGDHYRSKFMEIFRRKLGLETNEGEEDENLVAVLLQIMSKMKADFTMTFRDLSEIGIAELKSGRIREQFWALRTITSHEWFSGWVKLYVKRLEKEDQADTQRQEIMQRTNPRYILRNWIAQLAVEKAEDNDYSAFNKIYQVFQHPFTYQDEAETMGFADPPPEWAYRLKVSCSS